MPSGQNKMDTPDGIDTEKGNSDNTNSISIEPNY